jgi:hypothetical protein
LNVDAVEVRSADRKRRKGSAAKWRGRQTDRRGKEEIAGADAEELKLI